MEEHQIYMRRCIELARLSNGYNRPNPEVGSLIVYQGKIIGEGWHQRYGEGHAEVNAVAAVKDKSLLAESTIYVTLEPCFHFGKTPPCVDLILKHRIPRVVIGCADPYHEVAGRSIQKLKEAGVDVTLGILKEEVAWLNRRFFTNVRKKRPYVVLKYAISADGFMGREGENVAISGALSKRWVHKMRAEEAAILVGTNTALSDNPQLNLRQYFGSQPLRLLLDRTLRVPQNFNLFDASQPTVVFTEKDIISDKENLEFVKLPFGTPNLLPAMLEYLQQRRIASVLVEGGQQLLNGFIEAGLWDEAYRLQGRVRLNEGIDAPSIHQRFWADSILLGEDEVDVYLNEK